MIKTGLVIALMHNPWGNPYLWWEIRIFQWWHWIEYQLVNEVILDNILGSLQRDDFTPTRSC